MVSKPVCLITTPSPNVIPYTTVHYHTYKVINMSAYCPEQWTRELSDKTINDSKDLFFFSFINNSEC